MQCSFRRDYWILYLEGPIHTTIHSLLRPPCPALSDQILFPYPASLPKRGDGANTADRFPTWHTWAALQLQVTASGYLTLLLCTEYYLDYLDSYIQMLIGMDEDYAFYGNRKISRLILRCCIQTRHWGNRRRRIKITAKKNKKIKKP